MDGQSPRTTFRLNGRRFELDKSLVTTRLSDVVPEPVRQHGVRVNDVVFPVKQAFECATGLRRQDFTSHTARRHLAALGLEIVGEVEARVPTREPSPPGHLRTAPTGAGTSNRPVPEVTAGDLLLVTCVKEKLGAPAAARDLYVSTLFKREREYAERSGKPWFILSAEHGLVAPDEWLAPYERYLPDTSPAFRAAWGAWVVERLELLAGRLSGRALEIHAGSAYVDAIRAPLGAKGARIVEPLAGLTLGQRLAWYRDHADSEPETPFRSTGAHDAAAEFCRMLTADSEAVRAADFVARGSNGLTVPGLYSWWVDAEGAADLTRGLGLPVQPGLIYAGLAGATRWPSGKRSANTLWSRIAGMHLGRKHEFSTFRRSVGSILASAMGASTIDEAALTEWMGAHLRVLAIPFTDADTLGRLEESVLRSLDPPLNLQGMSPSPVRDRLRDLRRSQTSTAG